MFTASASDSNLWQKTLVNTASTSLTLARSQEQNVKDKLIVVSIRKDQDIREREFGKVPNNPIKDSLAVSSIPMEKTAIDVSQQKQPTNLSI